MSMVSRKRRFMVQDLAKWFAEHGAMSSHQFAKHPKRPVGIKLRDIKRICGGWDRLITYIYIPLPCQKTCNDYLNIKSLSFK